MSDPDDIFISVITTVKNESRHIRELLESLVMQEPPFEVIVVDAASTDNTMNIVKEFASKYDCIRLFSKPGKRGASMNYGVRKARGNVLSFIGGDCIAHHNWLHNVREHFSRGADILVGKVVMLGYFAFEDLERVELFHKGHDITYPGCVTSYRTGIFRELGGFDSWFVTAEDIDLNYRAVDRGYAITIVENEPDTPAIYHRARETMNSFFRQAFWNGYGRKQLTLKHGKLWGSYSFRQMVIQKPSVWKLARLGVATLGYMYCMISDRAPVYKDGNTKTMKEANR